MARHIRGVAKYLTEKRPAWVANVDDFVRVAERVLAEGAEVSHV